MVRASFRMMRDAAADLVWPARCGGCDAPGTILCERCNAAIPLIDPATACPRCGAPDGDHGCAECSRVPGEFGPTRCAAVLDQPVARLIRLHKDAAELRLTPVLAELAVSAAADWIDWAHAVAPVPASPAAFATRGFDHGALLAAAIWSRAGVPAIDCLRARPRRDQRTLTREQRLSNARASIIAVPGVTVPDRVLVVDDVLTTGATVRAAAAALLSAGAREVRVVAVARACGGRP